MNLNFQFQHATIYEIGCQRWRRLEWKTCSCPIKFLSKLFGFKLARVRSRAGI